MVIAIELHLTRRGDGEAFGGRCALVTLELVGRASDNTSSAVLVGDLSVVDAVRGTRLARTKAVLTIADLTEGTALNTITRDVDAEAA